MMWALRRVPYFLAKTLLVIIGFFRNFNSSVSLLNEGNDLLYCVTCEFCDREGCKLQAAVTLIISSVIAGREQDLPSSAAPPCMTARAAFSRTPGDAKAHILVCWVEPLSWECFPVSHLKWEDPTVFALRRAREVSDPSLHFIVEESEVARERKSNFETPYLGVSRTNARIWVFWPMIQSLFHCTAFLQYRPVF